MCFNQDSAITKLDDKPLKLVEQFRYLGSNISRTESAVKMHIGRAWTAVDWLSIIWSSDLCDKI